MQDSPQTETRKLPQPPPKLVVSKPTNQTAGSIEKRRIARQRQATRSNESIELPKSTSQTDWIDVDAPSSRRRKSSQLSRSHNDTSFKSVLREHIRPLRTDPRSRRPVPTRSQTHSSNGSIHNTQLGDQDPQQQYHRDRSSSRRSRRRDYSTAPSQNPIARSSPFKRGNDLMATNPSLLSVLTTMTGNSERSSGSGSTITQQSYNQRRRSSSSKITSGRNKYSKAESTSNALASSRWKPSSAPHYLDSNVVEEDRDDRSTSSSEVSSHDDASDAGSSELPDTPSSRSTFPSPTSTRSQSVAELRRKYDPQHSTSTGASRSGSRSPDSVSYSCTKPPDIEDIIEDDEHSPLTHPSSSSDTGYFSRQQRSSSGSSQSSRHASDRLWQQEESMRQHLAHTSGPSAGHFIEPVAGQHRSPSASSAHSDHPAYPTHPMALQYFQWPGSPDPTDHARASAPVVESHSAAPDRPCAPDAPDLSRYTLRGYEKVAVELASTESPVPPLYRKFEYLHHRILLHLQDELCELEEQLRIFDEIIAQQADLATSTTDSTITPTPLPASRRADNHHGSEIHLQRTHLLGRIFQKTEQYHRAMAAYTGTQKDARPAHPDQVHAYKEWLTTNTPIHESETRFLLRTDDLIEPRASRNSSIDGKSQSSSDEAAAPAFAAKHAIVVAAVPTALMLPLLLFAVIPGVAGRLLVTALVALGAFLVGASVPDFRALLPARDWAACGAAYVLLMGAIAGCIPSAHS